MVKRFDVPTSEADRARQQHVEDHLAYEGRTELVKWIDTSSHGFKITLGLKDRAELDYFDGVMTMRKNRGGQRYQAMITARDELTQHEMQFCGRGWSESGGAHAALHIPHIEDQVFWRQLVCRDQVEKDKHGETIDIMLMELDDNEEIVNQAKRARQRGILDPQPKGGPRSKAVAIALQDIDFGVWLDRRSIYKVANFTCPRTFAERDLLVKDILGVESKKDLDNGNDLAWNKWENQFMRPFLRWSQRK